MTKSMDLIECRAHLSRPLWLAWNATICLALIASIAGCHRREMLSGAQLVVLEGASLFTADDTSYRSNSVVVIDGDRIARIGTVGDFTYSPEVRVVDVRGRYVVPGFVDMHVHIPGNAREETARELLAHGVTTARSPGSGDSTRGVLLRDLLARGAFPGPRLITGDKFINGPGGRIPGPGFVNVRSPDEMRGEIRRQKSLGVDLIKLYWDVAPDLVKVAIDEAHALGLQVAGHMRVTSWTEAAQLGINSLEHSGADGPTWELVEDPDLRARLRGQDPPRSASQLKPSEFYALVAEHASTNGPRMDSLAAALVRNRVVVVPTLVVMQSLYYGDHPAVLARMEPDQMPARFLEHWDTYGPGWRIGNPFVLHTPTGKAQDLTSGKMMMSFSMEVVHSLHKRGVLLTTGTDLGMPWITPGVGLHREFELLVDTGIAPRDVLLMATRNGAEALRLMDQIGTIAPGKLADMVILRSDLLVDIRNSRSIEAVYRLGRRYVPDSVKVAK